MSRQPIPSSAARSVSAVSSASARIAELVTTYATLNHRDFTVVRPRHAGAFELLP
ncbi:MAG: hypothetical protein ACRDOK_27860 [Streptosporangiaceae bacterium]